MQDLTTNDERNLLLYLEDRAVNNFGRLIGKNMNTDDIDICKRWKESKFLIYFERIPFKLIKRFTNEMGPSTHLVHLSTEAYEKAAILRMERSERLFTKYGIKYAKET